MNLYHPNCHDADSCGFFFDGYALEMIWTNTNSVLNFDDSSELRACTMPLTEQENWELNDWISYYQYIPDDIYEEDVLTNGFYQCGTTAETEDVDLNDIGFTNRFYSANNGNGV